MSTFPAYEITYLWFIQAIYVAVFGLLAADSFFYGSALWLGSHFKCVQRQLGNIQFEDAKGRISSEFRSLIVYHDRILRNCELLNEIFEWILFSQFLFNSMQLCVIAYQLTLVNMAFGLHYIIENTINLKCYIIFIHEAVARVL